MKSHIWIRDGSTPWNLNFYDMDIIDKFTWHIFYVEMAGKEWKTFVLFKSNLMFIFMYLGIVALTFWSLKLMKIWKQWFGLAECLPSFGKSTENGFTFTLIKTLLISNLASKRFHKISNSFPSINIVSKAHHVKWINTKMRLKGENSWLFNTSYTLHSHGMNFNAKCESTKVKYTKYLLLLTWRDRNSLSLFHETIAVNK